MSARSEPLTTLVVGCGLAVVIGSALMVGDFILHWPTDADRARLYFLLDASPVDLALPYLVLVFTAGLSGSWLAGWRGVTLFGGVGVGALIVVAFLFAGTYSFAAWQEPEMVTEAGKWVRLVTAAACVALAILSSRHLRRQWFPEKVEPVAEPASPG